MPKLKQNTPLQDFPLYFKLGIAHILDWQGYDHILFVMALCGVYSWLEWRNVIILVTAFTIGHSITLALSVFNYLPISMVLIEFLIPLTILITALTNILLTRKSTRSQSLNYFLGLLFGLIHGLGFSGYLKSLLGKEIIYQLLAFNLGLEMGQLVIISVTLLFSYFILTFLKINQREWTLFLSSAIFGVALTLALNRFNALFS